MQQQSVGRKKLKAPTLFTKRRRCCTFCGCSCRFVRFFPFCFDLEFVCTSPCASSCVHIRDAGAAPVPLHIRSPMQLAIICHSATHLEKCISDRDALLGRREVYFSLQHTKMSYECIFEVQLTMLSWFEADSQSFSTLNTIFQFISKFH